MTPPETPPLFCDDCSSLALAELDGAPLCEACIKAAVDGVPEHALANRIQPLHLLHPARTQLDLDVVQSTFSIST